MKLNNHNLSTIGLRQIFLRARVGLGLEPVVEVVDVEVLLGGVDRILEVLQRIDPALDEPQDQGLEVVQRQVRVVRIERNFVPVPAKFLAGFELRTRPEPVSQVLVDAHRVAVVVRLESELSGVRICSLAIAASTLCGLCL